MRLMVFMLKIQFSGAKAGKKSASIKKLLTRVINKIAVYGGRDARRVGDASVSVEK